MSQVQRGTVCQQNSYLLQTTAQSAHFNENIANEMKEAFAGERRRARAQSWREAGYAKPLYPNSYSTYDVSLLLKLAT